MCVMVIETIDKKEKEEEKKKRNGVCVESEKYTQEDQGM